MNSSTDLSRKANPIQQAVKKVFGFPEMGILLTLAILVLLMSVLSERFFTFGNLMSVLRQISMTCIVAVGLAFVLICGAFDLSTSAVLAFGGVFCAWMYSTGVNIWLAALIAISVGAMIGVLNSVIVVKLGVSLYCNDGDSEYYQGLCISDDERIYHHFRHETQFLGKRRCFWCPKHGNFHDRDRNFGRYSSEQDGLLASGCSRSAAMRRLHGCQVFPCSGSKRVAMRFASALCVLSGILNAFNLSVADTAAWAREMNWNLWPQL